MFHGVPKLVVDDPQLGYLDNESATRRIEAGHAAACGGVLDEALAPPSWPTNVGGVVEDAGALLGVSPDRRVAPGSAIRSGLSARIERSCDCPWPLTCGEAAVDLTDDFCLGLVDPAFACDGLAVGVDAPDHIITKASPTAALTSQNPSL